MNEVKKPKSVNVEVIPLADDAGVIRLPHAILLDYIARYHPHLADAKIALAWQYSWSEDADGRLRLGQVRKASDLDAELHGYDFIILLNSAAWNAADFTRAQMEALIDHELTHCQVTKDEDGEEKRDENGRLVWRVRGHDIEEFREIVTRHGLWKGDLEAFAKVAMAKASEADLLFQSPEPEYKNPPDGINSVTVTTGGKSVTLHGKVAAKVAVG